MSKYQITKERDGYAVSAAKTGLILVTFDTKLEAQEYREAQIRADEQSQVLGDFNRAALLRELAAEFA